MILSKEGEIEKARNERNGTKKGETTSCLHQGRREGGREYSVERKKRAPRKTVSVSKQD